MVALPVRQSCRLPAEGTDSVPGTVASSNRAMHQVTVNKTANRALRSVVVNQKGNRALCRCCK